MKTSEADVVIGSRFLTKNKTIPRYRIVGMKVLNLFTQLQGTKITDSQSGYRAYSRKVIEKIKSVVDTDYRIRKKEYESLYTDKAIYYKYIVAIKHRENE